MNGTLHLHAQPLPHGDAIVIADEEGLAALKAAVEVALSHERGIGGARPLTADGEV